MRPFQLQGIAGHSIYWYDVLRVVLSQLSCQREGACGPCARTVEPDARTVATRSSSECRSLYFRRSKSRGNDVRMH
jgi:hypothetical protein